jgi:hypothetical protein
MPNEHADHGRFKGRYLGFVHTNRETPKEDLMISRLGTAAILAAATVGLATIQAAAATFAAWQVANVPFGDTLNVRKYPSSASQKQAAYPNGTVLQMTGKCTGGVNLLDISGQPQAEQEQLVRYRWCQVWHDPAQNGNFVTGWVYGRYITPH